VVRGRAGEADLSTSFKAQARNEWSYKSTPSISPLGVVFNKAKRQLHVLHI
jgi:hypothetical protein